MTNTEPIDIARRFTGVRNYAESVKDSHVRAHYLWEVAQLTSVVHPTDLTTEELISLAALLIPAHARFLAQRTAEPRPPRTGLRIVR